mmetsp:Transcript_98718/g.247377  ORF Transcript_98718/g.247377 Transcript_98718/m.247377 type:complete len:214 (-) Transcript_98718:1485-2126(-)
MGLRETEDRQQGTRRGVRLAAIFFPMLLLISHADICIDDVALQIVVDEWLEGSRLPDVVPHEACIEGLEVVDAAVRGAPAVVAGLLLGIVLLVVGVDLADMQCKVLVLFAVYRVEQQEEQVEAGQQRRRQIDVLYRRLVGVVPAEDGVGSGQDGGPAIQRRCDAGFRDGDRLLLHDLVDCGAVALLHLVELVDAADAHVRQHQGPTLEGHLAS